MTIQKNFIELSMEVILQVIVNSFKRTIRVSKDIITLVKKICMFSSLFRSIKIDNCNRLFKRDTDVMTKEAYDNMWCSPFVLSFLFINIHFSLSKK